MVGRRRRSAPKKRRPHQDDGGKNKNILLRSNLNLYTDIESLNHRIDLHRKLIKKYISKKNVKRGIYGAHIVLFKGTLSSLDGRMDGQTDGWTVGRTDPGRLTDPAGRYIMRGHTPHEIQAKQGGRPLL